jgi:hypothetical protein
MPVTDALSPATGALRSAWPSQALCRPRARHFSLLGLTAVTVFAMSWTHLRARLILTQWAEPDTAGARPQERRCLLTKLSAIELPSPPSSGITIQATR